MRACKGSGSVGPRVSLRRISRQRSAWLCSSARSSAKLPSRRRVARQLLGHHGDGGERRAELVRGRGGQAVERVQLLLAGQHHLGGGQRIGHLARLLGEPPGVERQEQHAGEHRGQHADIVERRQIEAARRVPRQRPVEEYEQRGGPGRQHAERDRVARRQRGGRDRHRRHDQEHEGVLDAAGQIEQRGELKDVVGQQDGGERGAEPGARGVAHAQEDVEPCGQRDQGQADADVELEAEAEVDVADGRQLADHAEPAQAHGRLQAQTAFAPFLRAVRTAAWRHSCSFGDSAFDVHRGGRPPCFAPAAAPDRGRTSRRQHPPGAWLGQPRTRTISHAEADASDRRRRAAACPGAGAAQGLPGGGGRRRHRFHLARGSVTALLGGNGAGKTTTIAMLMGLVIPTSGEARVFGADMARERHKVLHRMNFESPYVDVPMRLTVRQNLEVFGRLYGVRDFSGRIAEIAEELQARRPARSALRQAVGRAEDACQPRQGAPQRARAAAARRADRLARSRHRRLGAHQAGGLLPGRAAPPSCSPPTTWRRWSAWPTG